MVWVLFWQLKSNLRVAKKNGPSGTISCPFWKKARSNGCVSRPCHSSWPSVSCVFFCWLELDADMKRKAIIESTKGSNLQNCWGLHIWCRRLHFPKHDFWYLNEKNRGSNKNSWITNKNDPPGFTMYQMCFSGKTQQILAGWRYMKQIFATLQVYQIFVNSVVWKICCVILGASIRPISGGQIFSAKLVHLRNTFASRSRPANLQGSYQMRDLFSGAPLPHLQYPQDRFWKRLWGGIGSCTY